MEEIKVNYDYNDFKPLEIKVDSTNYKIEITTMQELYDWYIWTNVGGLSFFGCLLFPFLKFQNNRLGELMCYYINESNEKIILWSGIKYIQRNYTITIPNGVSSIYFDWNEMIYSNNSGQIEIKLVKESL